MAEFDSRSHSGEANYSIYVLDVVPRSDNCRYEIYVGSTWKSIEQRLEEHREGGSKAAQIFRSTAKVGAIRWDLMNGFPKFHSRDAVERAERRVAKWLVNRGFAVRCNMLEKD